MFDSQYNLKMGWIPRKYVACTLQQPRGVRAVQRTGPHGAREASRDPSWQLQTFA